MNANTIFKRTKRVLRDHGADIFSVLAGIGVIATGVSAYNAGKNEQILETDECERSHKVSNLLVPISCGAGTIGCIYAARKYGKLKEESLLAACSVLALYGKRKEQAGDSETVRGIQALSVDSGTSIENTGYGDIIFTEDLTGRRFKSSLESVYSAIDLLQDEFKRHNFVPLNSFYAYLGIQPTSAGDILGWSVNQSILDPYLDEVDYSDMKDALTDLGIFVKDYPVIGWVIHYPVMPLAGIPGVGPCNF